MYLGGLPENRAGLILPTELWTAMLNYGYVGCIRDLFIDGRSKNIRQLAEAQNAAGVKSSCSRLSTKQCDSYPCKNNAVCKDGWNRFICDCTGTGYWGRTCERGKSSLLCSVLTELRLWRSCCFCAVHRVILMLFLKPRESPLHSGGSLRSLDCSTFYRSWHLWIQGKIHPLHYSYTEYQGTLLLLGWVSPANLLSVSVDDLFGSGGSLLPSDISLPQFQGFSFCEFWF